MATTQANLMASAPPLYDANPNTALPPQLPTQQPFAVNNPNPDYNPDNNQFDETKFQQLIKQRELNPQIAQQLREVLSTCEIVLLCDDSDSMALTMSEENVDPFAPQNSTRWLELKRLCKVLIEFITSLNHRGTDIYFLNRGYVKNVTSATGLQAAFAAPPNGGTPLKAAISNIYNDKRNIINMNRKLLLVIITDGESSDCTRNELFNLLTMITANGNVHVSFAECTDNAEDMEYLDVWDGQIRNYDNTDDYREELRRIKAVQGQQFKFDYTDYVIKILLATFVRWYFNLDQVKVVDTRNQNQPQSNYVPVKMFQPATTTNQAIPMQQIQQIQQTQPVYQQTQQTQQLQQYNNRQSSNQDNCCVIL